MLIPFDGQPQLLITTHFDPEMAALADRHYSRRTVGARQFMYSGRKIVIRDPVGLVLFGWIWPDPAMRMDDQDGYQCAIFRNESARLSSEIILECEQIAFRKWGPNRMYTFVDSRKVRSANPGYCYKRAGWRYEGLTKGGKHILAKYPSEKA